MCALYSGRADTCSVLPHHHAGLVYLIYNTQIFLLNCILATRLVSGIGKVLNLICFVSVHASQKQEYKYPFAWFSSGWEKKLRPRLNRSCSEILQRVVVKLRQTHRFSIQALSLIVISCCCHWREIKVSLCNCQGKWSSK